MIVYLASYPRCGNSLLRDVIHNYFQRPTANIYPHEVPYPRRLKYAENWRLSDQISGAEKRKRCWLVWNKWIALYDLNIAPHTKNMRYLVHGCKPILTRANRWRLAQEKTIFFLKTHERPYRRYYPGEYVIQIVRHPGPVLRSYHNLMSAEMPSLTLDDYLHGRVHFGSWSEYHRDWQSAALRLKTRYLQIRYEDANRDPLSVCQAIQELIQLPYREDAQLRSFESLQKQDASMYGFGSNNAWEQVYSEEQLSVLKELHSEMMRHLGYDVPAV
jgi:hypothetical protein